MEIQCQRKSLRRGDIYKFERLKKKKNCITLATHKLHHPKGKEFLLV